MLSALLAAPAHADSFGGWTFDSPDGYEREAARSSTIYNGPQGKFLFLPPMPSRGGTAQQAAPGILDEIAPDAPARREIVSETLPDGGTRSIWFATDGKMVYLVTVLAVGDTAAAAVFLTPDTDAGAIAAETEALIGVTYAPVEVGPIAPSALPPMNWPDPPEGLIAATRARMSVPEARAQGIDPEFELMQGTFDCYRQGVPRAVDPRPDLRIASQPNRFFSATDGRETWRGVWRVADDETLGRVLYLSAPFSPDDAVFVHTDGGLGQTFNIDDPFATDGEMTCVQDGPAADTLRRELTAVAPVKGLMACIWSDGTPFRLIYADGIYRADGAQGRYQGYLEGNYGWAGKLTFSGGPLDLMDGGITFDAGGLTKLSLTQTWNEGSIFYSSSETTTFAECTAPAPKRPRPVYGTEPAADAPVPAGGLPEGYFESFEGRSNYAGGSPTFVYRTIYTFVGPGGRIVEDPDLDMLGDMPDCGRTTPSGEEVCGAYRIEDGKLTRRAERDAAPDAWSDPEPVTIGDDRFSVGDIEYSRLAAVTPDAIIGHWTAEDFTGSGPGASPMGGVGIFSDSETGWIFAADGRFD